MKLRYKVSGGLLLLSFVAVATLARLLSHNAPCGEAPSPATGGTMKAVVYRCYGSVDVLKLEQIARPAPADDRMIVKVHAASVNPLDWHYMRGEPFFMRPMSGIGAPQRITMGVDFAGSIVSVGKNVTRFKPGDEIFGGRDGAFGEYVSVSEKGSIAMKPPNITFEQAASVPIAAVSALQALRDKGKLQAGQSVLINGASGGVGTFAVQIAKAFGAQVTGVCSTRNADMVRSIGADRIVDYTQEDFTKDPQHYDLIIDTVGSHTLSEYRRVLNPHGSLVMVGSTDKGRWLGPLTNSVVAWLYSPFISQKMIFLLADLNAEDLTTLGDMLKSGQIKPVIDRRYTLDEVPEAIRYVEQGHARGKVVVAIAGDEGAH